MADVNENDFAYELHTIIASSQHINQQSFSQNSTTPFQYKSLRHDLITQISANSEHAAYAKIDRLNIKFNFRHADVRIGRQAISWGSGRFWQPTDVFGAFNATELIRDYKSGIDVLNASVYPDAFSHVNFIYVIKESTSDWGIRYSRPLGEQFYASIVGANILDYTIAGGSLEFDWHGAGVHMEGTAIKKESSVDSHLITGVEYQFLNEWLITTELYFNSLGSNESTGYSKVLTSEYSENGLLKQLSQKLLAISLQKSITPLTTINYMWLSSLLTESSIAYSSLYQLTFIYSTSNESDLRLTFTTTTGKKADLNGIPQSEFGQIPTSIGFMYRLYF